MGNNFENLEYNIYNRNSNTKENLNGFTILKWNNKSIFKGI